MRVFLPEAGRCEPLHRRNVGWGESVALWLLQGLEQECFFICSGSL